MLRVLLEAKVYTERISQNEKINVDGLFFLDMVHGLLSAGNERTFIKRLEKEDIVAMLVARDTPASDVITLIEATGFADNLCEVL